MVKSENNCGRHKCLYDCPKTGMVSFITIRDIHAGMINLVMVMGYISKHLKDDIDNCLV